MCSAPISRVSASSLWNAAVFEAKHKVDGTIKEPESPLHREIDVVSMARDISALKS
jgi:hypothetical protein